MQNHWGDQLRRFRLAGEYKSQGAWVNAASTLITALSSSQFDALLSNFGADDGAFDFSQTMLSRWETGTRKPPRERSRHLCLIWAMAQLTCIGSPNEADEWMATTDLKPLTRQERSQIWPHLNQPSNEGSADSPFHEKNLGESSTVEGTLHKHPPLSTDPNHDVNATHAQIYDWGEAPHIGFFYGRSEEQEQIKRWLVKDRCQLVGIWGMGGQGKTTLAAKLSREVADQFDGVIWRSLLNAPPLDEVLGQWIQLLSDKRLFELPTSLTERLLLLFDLLRERRYLLVLDNVESILEADESLGRYRLGYESYGQLILRFGETSHESCLLLTSREEPREFTRLRRPDSNSTNHFIQTLKLEGLDPAASEALMLDDAVSGTSSSIEKLTQRYSGHPLALMLVSRTITEFYAGDIDLFLEQEPGLFDDIQELLAQHIARVTNSELSILFWLAIEREPISTQTLRENLVLSTEQSQLMASLRSLQRRSLIESHPDPQSQMPRFTLQNVVIEYLTGQIVQEATADFLAVEVDEGKVASEKWWGQSFLHFHALVKVTGKSYNRESQERLILRPIAENLQALMGQKELRRIMLKRLDTLRDSGIIFGYTAGNILNLLLALQEELAGANFSHLPVWQAALDTNDVKNVNFAHADLADSVFHENFIRIISIALHPDGDTLFAGTTHGQLGVYDIATMQAIEKHTGSVQHIAALEVSTDGQTLVSSGGDGIVYVWDICKPEDTDDAKPASKTPYQNRQNALSLKLRYQFEENERVRAIAFCADDSLIAVGCTDEIRLRDLSTGDLQATLKGRAKSFSMLAYAPAHRILVSGGWRNSVLLWRLDPLEAKPVFALPQPPADISSVNVSPDGNLLAVACHDGTINLWDLDKLCDHVNNHQHENLDELQPESICIGHTSKINMVTFSSTGALLASSSIDGTIRIWDMSTSQTRHLLQGHRDEVDAVRFSPDDTYVVSGSGDRTLRLWDSETGKEIQKLGSYTDGTVTAVDFSPDGSLLVSGSDDGSVRIWNMSTQTCQHLLRHHTNHIFDVACSPCGRTIASASLDQTIGLWDADSGKLTHELTDHSGEVTAASFHPTQPLLISGSNDRTVRLWNTQTGTLEHKWDCTGGAVWSIAISPDGKTVAASSSSGVIYLWDLQSKQLTQELSYHEDLVWSVAFSPDGRYIASAGYEGIVCLCDRTNKTTANQETADKQWVHGALVRSVAFSADSRELVSVGDDEVVCLWDVETGNERYRRPGKDTAALHPNGKLFATGADQRAIQLWDIATGDLSDRLELEGPFHGNDITGVRGISAAKIETLKLMGAIDRS